MSRFLSALPPDKVIELADRAIRRRDKKGFDRWINDGRIVKSSGAWAHALHAAFFVRDDYYLRRLLEKAPVSALRERILFSNGKETLSAPLPVNVCRFFRTVRGRVKNPAAAECFFERRLALVLQCGADPNAETDSGRTPLISAVLADAPRLCACLLTWGARPTGGAFFRDGQTKATDTAAANVLNYPKNAYEWALLSPDKALSAVFDPYLSPEEKIKTHTDLLKKQQQYMRSCRRLDRCLLGASAVLVFLTVLGGLSRCGNGEVHAKTPAVLPEKTVTMPSVYAREYR